MRRPLSELDGLEIDVASLGGGINGASAAQQLAAAGLDVLLVDKGDFGSGATARSSRLLHCGLRYLAPGRSLLEFARHPARLATALRMARAAMAARAELVRTTPERVVPMRFCFPLYRSGPYRPWQIDLAFGTLRALGTGGVPLAYERIGAEEARRRPLLEALRDGGDLEGVACFREYQIDWPERLCLDAVLDAERLGARVRNHTRGALVGQDASGRWQVRLTDMLAGPAHATVTARRVLNLAGVWIDAVAGGAAPGARRRVVGTKGAHIVVQLPPACAGVGIAALNRRGEPLYCVPWRGLHYIGPTETLYEGDPDRVTVSADEIAFLLEEARHLVPGLRLSRESVVSTWAGVRPLTHDPDLPLGRRSREVHDLGPDGLPGVWAMTAGPVMTYRSAGRLLAGVAGRGLAPRRPAAAPDYGAVLLPETPNAAPLRAGSARPTLANLRYAARVEHAATLEDVLFRRVGAAWDRPLGADEIARAADAVGEALHWSTDERAAAAAAFAQAFADLHGVPPASAPAQPSEVP
jgi:glycerol-3-phosphate dehydrogenase